MKPLDSVEIPSMKDKVSEEERAISVDPAAEAAQRDLAEKWQNATR